MEAKTEQKKLIVLKKPQGEISQYASYGMIKWGVDDYGKKYVKWGGERMVADVSGGRGRRKRRKKKGRGRTNGRRKMIYYFF